MAITSEEANVVPQPEVVTQMKLQVDEAAKNLILRLLEQQYMKLPLRYADFSDLLPTFKMDKLRSAILKVKFAIEKCSTFRDLHVAVIWVLLEEGYK